MKKIYTIRFFICLIVLCNLTKGQGEAKLSQDSLKSLFSDNNSINQMIVKSFGFDPFQIFT